MTQIDKKICAAINRSKKVIQAYKSGTIYSKCNALQIIAVCSYNSAISVNKQTAAVQKTVF